jgi:hypothetical protein
MPSLENPKKLMRLQRTQLSKNAVELASVDLYAIDSDAPTAINGDDNAAGSKGIAKDAKAQSMRPSVGLGLVIVPLELRLKVRSYTYYSLMQS